jgi:hypothetical protein
MTYLRFISLFILSLVALPFGGASAQQAVSLYVTDAVVTFDPSSPPSKVNLLAVSTSKQSDGTFYNSSSPITWSSDTTSVCTVPSAGKNDYTKNGNTKAGTASADVTILTPGHCIINAFQDAATVTGVGSWGSASASNVIEITAKSGTTLINFPQPADIKFSDALFLQAAVTFNNVQAPAVIAYNATGDPSPSVCTVAASGLVTPKGIGTCTVRAYYGGGTPYYPGVAPNSPVTRSFKILPAKDTITLSTPASVALDAGPVILVAATSSGTPVTYSASGACATVTNTDYTKSPPVISAVVQPTNVGTCTITASSSASANFTVADQVIRMIQITGQTNKITFPQVPTTAFSSTSPVLQASAASGGAVTYALAGTTTTTTNSTGSGTSSTTSTTTTTSNVCTVTPSGAVTFVAPGQCSISASQGAIDNYAAATPVTMSFNISPNRNAITFTKPADQPFSAGTLTVTATASSGRPVTYVSTNTSVCTVAAAGSSGTITFVSSGVCSITASQDAVTAAPSTYFAAATSVTQVFKINPSGNAITFPQPADIKLTATPPALTASLPANAPAGLSVGYASQSPAVCTVTPAGALSLKTAGYCSVTASQVGASPAGVAVAAPASVTFQVLRGDNVITFNPAAPTSVALASRSLVLVATSNASMSSPTASPVAFTSTTATICTVTPAGGVTLVARGTCLISATHSGDANYVPAPSVQLRISVTAGISVVTFGPLPSTPISSPAPTLTATSSLGYNITFASTTASTCSVTKSGANSIITFAALGTCSITASDGTAQVSQAFQITPGANTISFAQPVNVAVTAAPPVLAAKATSGQPVVYAAATPGVCSVTPAGIVTLVAGGTCAITASQPAVGTFAAAAPVTRTFTVTGASVSSATISFPMLADTIFTSVPPVLAATASSGLPVSYATTTATVCTLSGARIAFITGGICSITATQAGNATNAAASPVTRTFQVLPAANVISFSAIGNATLPANLPTLTATASSRLPVSYSSNTTTICTVTADGAIALVAPGTCSIAASQGGNASFVAAVPVSRTFTVNQAGNVITFPQPAATPLTSPAPVLTATASSGLAVSYTSITVSVCKVTTAGAITFVTSGTCAITASQAGQTTIAAALPVTRTFLVQAVVNSTALNAPAIAAAKVGTAAKQQVAPVTATITATTTRLAASSPTPGLGQSTTFTATVTPTPPSGTVTFYEGTTPLCASVALVGSTATCTTAFTTAGSRSITASYGGGGGFATSTSVALGLTSSDQRVATTSAIGKFVARRNDFLATNGPDGNRQIDRLNEANGAQMSATGSRLAPRGGIAAMPRLDDQDTRAGGLPARQPGLFGGSAFTRGLGFDDDSGAGGVVQAGGLRLNGATEGGVRFGFATSLRDITRGNAESDARKAAEAGFGWSTPDGPSAARPNPFDVWVEGKFASVGDTNLARNQDGTLAFGADYVVNPAFLFGTVVQFDSVSQRTTDTANSAAGVQGTGWMAGPYVTLRLTPEVHLQARAGWGQSNNTLTGQQAVGIGFQSTTWLASTTLSGRWTEGAWSFRPSASVSYLEDIAKAADNGFGAGATTVKSNLGQAKAGPEVAYRFELGRDTVIEPHAGVQMIWNFAQQTTAAGFGTLNGEVPGTGGVRGRLELGVRASTVGGIRLDVSGSYDGIGAADMGVVMGRAQIRVPLN